MIEENNRYKTITPCGSELKLPLLWFGGFLIEGKTWYFGFGE